MAMTGGTGVLVKETTVTDSGYTGKFRLYVYYKIVSQDINANTTTLSLGMYFTPPSGWTVGPWSKSSDSYLGTTSNTFNGAIGAITKTTWLKENQSLVVNHNPDGTGTATIYWKWGVKSSWGKYDNPKGSFTVDLPRIPRGATLSAAPNFTDEENPTITYSNPAGDLVDSLEACISLTSAVDDISYRSISKTGTSYTFNLTDAERNILRNGITTGESRTVYFYVRTRIGENEFHSYLTKTLTLVNHTPTLSPQAYVPTSSTTYALTGAQTRFIKGYTDVTVTTGAAARKNATIASQKITNSGQTVNAASGTITKVDNGTFTFSVTDSRGLTTTQTLTREIVNYIPLTCNFKPRIDVSGTATIQIDGNVFNASFGAQQNTLAIQIRYRVAGGTWGSWAGVNGTKSGNTYYATHTITGLDYRTKYGFQIKVNDKITTVTTAEITAIALPVFDWGENSFNFNVPVNFSAGYTQSANLISDGVAISDFIVEAGTNGIWSYRKWNSGMAECWGKQTINTAVSTAWGSLFVSGALWASNVDLPFTFKETPMINANLSANGAGGFLLASGSYPASATQTGGYEIARGTSGAANNYVINYDVRGRWK